MAKELSNFRQGDTKVVKIINSTPGFDITGHVFWLTLRVDFDSPTFIAQVKSTAGDHPDDDIPNNTIFLQLDSDVTSLIPVASYYWDIQSSDGSIPPLITTIVPTESRLKEKVKVMEQVTKDS